MSDVTSNKMDNATSSNPGSNMGNVTNNVQKNTFDFPDAAWSVLRAIEDAGHEAWFVGGCVRDSLMGRHANDVDIATSAHWKETAAACEAKGMHAHETGVKHGTVTIVVPANGRRVDSADGNDSAASNGPQAFEVTTYRHDSATSSDSRHPDSVEFVRSIEEDLRRRDFTMNAMAWHPERGLLDPHEGRADIERGVIRVVGDPSKRFAEDALRILRACRFASQLGFVIDGDTYEAMLSHKHLLARVSTERVTHELDRLLLGEHVHDALMRTVDVLAFVLPELVAMKGCEQRTKYHCYDVLEHTAWAVQEAEPSRLVRWAALFHDMGKPSSAFFDAEGSEHFYGHAKVSARMARGIMDRLGMGGAFKESVCTMVLEHSDKCHDTPRSVKRALAKVGGDVELFRSLLALKRADMLAHAPEYRSQAEVTFRIERTLEGILAAEEAFSTRHLKIDGNDVKAAGVPEGPGVGKVLQKALEAVIDGDVANEREDLLALVGKLANETEEGA